MTDFKNTAWDFTRTIEDRFANTTITATGTMRLSDVQWQEKGEMNGNPFFQLYRVDFSKGLTVSFKDGREFYSIPTIIGKHHIEHLCGRDLYIGNWVGGRESIALQWKVKGDKKDYTMQSVYQKSSS